MRTRVAPHSDIPHFASTRPDAGFAREMRRVQRVDVEVRERERDRRARAAAVA